MMKLINGGFVHRWQVYKHLEEGRKCYDLRGDEVTYNDLNIWYKHVKNFTVKDKLQGEDDDNNKANN